MIKNICFFKSDISGGGTERVTVNLANELSKNAKYNVHILDLLNEDNKYSYTISSRVKRNILNTKKNKIIFDVISSNVKILRYMKKNNIDIMINVQPIMALYTLIPCKIGKIKNIIWEHANYYQYRHLITIKVLRRLALLFSDYYLLLTKKDKKNFLINYKIKCKLDYIYNPINNVSQTKYEENSKIIMAAGHLKYVKGFDMLIDVAELVVKNHRNWKFIIYGDGEEYGKLKTKIIKKNLQNNIILFGRTNEIEKKYKKASMYLMTSRMEGLPLVLLEAKSNKLPCVSFNIQTGPDEIIRDGINGYLIPQYDIKEMAKKICYLIENKKIRNNFSSQAFLDIENFEMKNVIEKWERIIKKV